MWRRELKQNSTQVVLIKMILHDDDKSNRTTFLEYPISQILRTQYIHHSRNLYAHTYTTSITNRNVKLLSFCVLSRAKYLYGV